MKRLLSTMLAQAMLALIALLPSAVHPATPVESRPVPTVVKAAYKVYKAGIWIGTIEETFSREGDTYKIASDTDTAGPLRLLLRDHLTVSSAGTIGADGLKPSTYGFVRRNDQKKNISSSFNWEKNQIVTQHNGGSETFDLPPRTQDRISAMYQFMFNNPRTAEISLWMSQGKKAEFYRYRKQGEPTLTINGETISTVYYAREAAAGESKAHLWLAREKHFLPVKIIFEEASGGSLEQLLVSLHTE